MKHHSPQTRSRTRSLFTAAFVASLLLITGSTIFAQTSELKATAARSHAAREVTSRPEDEPVYFDSGARQVPASSTLTATQMSATSIGRVLSLLFDSARIDLQSATDPMVATWSGTVTIPTNAAVKPKPRSYLQDIRGSINKTADTRVTIFLELGGKYFVAEFPYGRRYSGNIQRRFVSAVKPGSSPAYTASIFIFAERRTTKGAVMVDIDGLDVDAVPRGTSH